MEEILLDLLDLDDPEDLELFNFVKRAGVCRVDLRFPLSRKKLGEIARGKIARLKRDVVHNQHVSGEVLPYETPFQSDTCPYVLGRIKRAQEIGEAMSHAPLPGVVFNEALQMRAGSTLQEAIVQAAHVKRGL